MLDKGSCDICDYQAEYEHAPPIVILRCPRCGEFCFPESEGFRKIKSPDERVRLSGWVREQNAAGAVPVRVTRERAARVVQMRLPGLRERSSRVLALLARDYSRANAWFVLDTVAKDVELQGYSYSRDEQEVLLLIQVLFEDAYLQGHGATAALTVKGLLAAEALGANKSSSAQGFVAMWFDEGLSDAWTNGFDPGNTHRWVQAPPN
jgi:hypothetical protein